MKSFYYIILLSFVFFGCKKKNVENFCEYDYSFKKTKNYIDYYKYTYLADSLFLEKKYNSSYFLLKKLFEEYKPINASIYYEYETYIISGAKIGFEDELCDDLKSLISDYGYNKSRVYDNVDLIKVIDACPIVKENIDLLFKKFATSINYELREEIYQMNIEDQRYRKNGEYNSYIQKQDSIDRYNSNRVVEIFEKYGYPNEKIIGNYLIDERHIDIKTILLHTKDSIRKNYFIPFLLDCVKKGKCNPKTYATLVDQLNIYNGKEQLFGTFDNVFVKKKKLNSIRKSVGLPNFGYEKWRLKKIYPNLNI